VPKFFCKEETLNENGTVKSRGTGELGRLEGEEPDSEWKQHQDFGEEPCQLNTGIAPATDIEPDWWSDTPEEGPAYRWFSLLWECCCQKKWVKADANPK